MTKTRAWDPVEHLNTDEDVQEYINAAFEDGDPQVISAALGDVARAKGMSTIAREAGLSRESLYRALSPEGNPTFDTVLRVTKALGVRMAVEKEDEQRLSA